MASPSKDSPRSKLSKASRPCLSEFWHSSGTCQQNKFTVAKCHRYDQFVSDLITAHVSKYPSYDVAGLLEEVGGGGEVEGVGETGEAEPEDEEVQEPEKTFLPCFDTESD